MAHSKTIQLREEVDADTLNSPASISVLRSVADLFQIVLRGQLLTKGDVLLITEIIERRVQKFWDGRDVDDKL